MMRIISYNLNGIRSAISKGWLDWLKSANPDVICLQELKANSDQIDHSPLLELGYHLYWHSAQKKGYSGVAVFSKIKPDHVEYGCGIKKYDDEGRVLRVDFGDFSVMSVYMPSGSSGEERQAFKMKWLEEFHDYILDLKKKRKKLIICGDYNICPQPIDIHNPKSNATTSGFLPEERAWVDQFLKSGFIDTFRYFNKEPHQYTWWSFRANSRAKNLGWRIDYNLATQNLKDKLRRVAILAEARHSDHCPVLLEIE
jgi:exodeoxyribonuclease-3